MQEFRDRVAVVTGAASGIGFGLAERFAQEGMKVVLADVEEPALEQANARLADVGAETLPVLADVSKWEDVTSLADQAYEAFGAVHIVCNNAGVSGGSRQLWESSIEDWRWVLGVNLWGVIHGMKAFVGRMIEQGEEGHVVNTASMAGLLYGSGAYGVSKHAVVALSEGLYTQLRTEEAKVGVSVLCPGFINTNIIDSARNRPEHLASSEPPPEAQPEAERMFRELLASGYQPSEVAEAVVAGIREDRFYIVPSQERLKEGIRVRADSVMNERNPQAWGAQIVGQFRE